MTAETVRSASVGVATRVATQAQIALAPGLPLPSSEKAPVSRLRGIGQALPRGVRPVARDSAATRTALEPWSLREHDPAPRQPRAGILEILPKHDFPPDYFST